MFAWNQFSPTQAKTAVEGMHQFICLLFLAELCFAVFCSDKHRKFSQSVSPSFTFPLNGPVKVHSTLTSPSASEASERDGGSPGQSRSSPLEASGPGHEVACRRGRGQ